MDPTRVHRAFFKLLGTSESTGLASLRFDGPGTATEGRERALEVE